MALVSCPAHRRPGVAYPSQEKTSGTPAKQDSIARNNRPVPDCLIIGTMRPSAVLFLVMTRFPFSFA